MTRHAAAAVIGAGPAGVAAALALAHVGIEVALIGPVAPGDAVDRRTTALIGPSIDLLTNLGVWQHCAGQAATITAVRIADDSGGLIRAPEVLFSAGEIGLASFGANLPNRALLAAFNAAAERQPRITRITAAVTAIEPTADAVHLRLDGGGGLAVRLVVAADGRGSKAPAAAGVAVHIWDYPQAALVTSFGHSRPHRSTVNELHRRPGPLTTVPLPGLRSALVWVEAPDVARRLAGLDDAAFAARLEERLQGVLGTIGALEPRLLYPLSGRRLARMAGRRIALAGEAAHVVPPIGAQGLNLGLRDAAALADHVAAAHARGDDIGAEPVLAAYDRDRGPDVMARAASIDLLNRSLLTDLVPVAALRGLAVHALASLPPLRRRLMQEGAGLATPLPSLMRGRGA